ncbi:MAG TPA: hypothetical protein VMQ56_11560 [Terracidiphilus sp.]|jgi:hypothetical protein|nr:hypothetical protein [Terracidiphilus sp.]
MKARAWVPSATRPARVTDAEKHRIVTACDAFIRDVLKPRFLPRIVPNKFNYPIDIHGVWAGGRYRFVQRYRSGHEDNRGEEFDAPFARIDCVGQDLFDIYWMRHTGKWWRLYTRVTLAVALQILETDGVLHPL